MNKALIGGVAAFALGLVGANHFLVKHAKEELPEQTAELLKIPATSVFKLKRLDVFTEGNSVVEHYELTTENAHVVSSETPYLLITHTANIGLFALNVDGEFTIDKPHEGLAQLLETFPGLNQSLTYHYNTVSKRAEYNGQLTLNQMNTKDERVKADFGSFHYTGVISPDIYSLDVKMSAISGNSELGQFSASGGEVSVLRDKKLKKDTASWHINGIEFEPAMSTEESYKIGSFGFNASSDTTDLATVSVGYQLKETQLPIVNAQGEKELLNLNADIRVTADNVFYKAIGALENLPQDITPEEQIVATFDAYKQVLSHGFDISEINGKVNNSTVKGTAAIKAADYSNVSNQQFSMSVLMNLQADINVELEQTLAALLLPNPAMIDAFFVAEDEHYISHFEFAEGRTVINGKAM